MQFWHSRKVGIISPRFKTRGIDPPYPTALTPLLARVLGLSCGLTGVGVRPPF